MKLFLCILQFTDVTWEDDSGLENLDPNVTKQYKLRSGLVASKDGVSTKYVIASVRTPSRRPLQMRDDVPNNGNVAAPDAPADQMVQASATQADDNNDDSISLSSDETNATDTFVDQDGSSESNTSVQPNQAVIDSTFNENPSTNENDDSSNSLVLADEMVHAGATHVTGDNDESTSAVPHDGNLEFIDMNPSNSLNLNDTAIAAIVDNLMGDQPFDFGRQNTDRTDSSTNNQSRGPFFGWPNTSYSSNYQPADPFFGRQGNYLFVKTQCSHKRSCF